MRSANVQMKNIFRVEDRLTVTIALLGTRKRDKKKTNKILKIMNVVEKLQRSLSLPKRPSWPFFDSDLAMDRDRASRYGLHEDVKKGHFSVIAIENGNAKRFVVPLCYLNNQCFLRLLEDAADEFGFEHEGALCVPCRWNELENILRLDGQC